jgi:ankyrin repeat protein/predicted DNA-binding WGR domain protein
MTSKRVLYKTEDLVAVVDSESDLGFEVYRIEEDVKAADKADTAVRALRFDRDSECEEQYVEAEGEYTVEVSSILRKVLKISEGVVEVDGSERAIVVISRKLTESLKHMASIAMRSGSEEEPSEDAQSEQGKLGKRKPLGRRFQAAGTQNKREETMDEHKSMSFEQDHYEESGMEESRDDGNKKVRKNRGAKEKIPKEQKPPRQPKEPRQPKQKKVIEYKRGKFNIKVAELAQDQAMDGTSSVIDSSCCDICSNRECIRAAATNNTDLFKHILDNKNIITTLFQEWGTDDSNTCLKICIRNNLQEFIDILLEELKNKPQGLQAKYYKTADSFAISQIDTGFNDKYAYGVATRKVALGRGNREGVNALCTDHVGSPNSSWLSEINNQIEDLDDDSKEFWKFLMKYCTVEMFKKIVSTLNLEFSTFFAYAVRGANVPLAAYIADRLIKSDGYGLNALHLKALTLTKAEDIGNFRGASVKKKSIGMNLIFPIFCAAINPHADVFIRMYESLDDRFIRDEDSSTIIFYAALNENHEVLQYLLENNTEFREANKKKLTPLMMAAMLGRSKNVELLMKKMDISKKKSRDGYAAIHYAILGNHFETVRVLIENGADVNLAGKDRLSPIAIASCYGYYDIAKLLLDKGAKVLKKDKFKRSPLIMAIKNCHARVASLLLAHGCPFDEPDSSDNYPIHYCCSYGCHEGLELLIKAGANPNVYNSWKLTPIAGAMMKNHYGIINRLLEYPDIDVNCKDDNGRTLLSNSIRILSEKTLNFARLIITKHKADITIPDLSGKTALHHLMLTHSAAFMAVNTYNIGILANVENLKQESAEKARIFLQLVELLCGDDLRMFNQVDNAKNTPLTYFFQNIPTMLQFNLITQCPSTQTYDNQARTYIKKLVNYHEYLDGDCELREAKYSFIRNLLTLVSKYYADAKNRSLSTIQNELAGEEASLAHKRFGEVNESILRLYLSGFRTYIASRFFRSALEFVSNQDKQSSFKEISYAKRVTLRQREELKTILDLLINKLELSVQGKHSNPSAKSEILHFLSARWSGLFNIPDDGKSALNIVAQQNQQQPTVQGFGSSLGTSSLGGFLQPQANQGLQTGGFNFGGFGAQQNTFGAFAPQQTPLFGGFPQQQNYGFLTPSAFGGLGGTGTFYSGQPSTVRQGNHSASTVKANCIDTSSSGVDEAVYAEMKVFRKLQITEREKITLDLLEFIRQSQDSTIGENWKDQHAFCQDILAMVPQIFYLNSVVTLELQTNENAEYVLKSCVEMIASNTFICKKFIGLAQLGVAEFKAGHLGTQTSLFAKFLEILPPMLANLSTYIDITQKKADRAIIAREIGSRMELANWMLEEFKLDNSKQDEISRSIAGVQDSTGLNEFQRLELEKSKRIYQRSLVDAFTTLCENTFSSFGCGALNALRLTCENQDLQDYLGSISKILITCADSMAIRLSAEGIVYNKQALVLAVARVASLVYAQLTAVDAVTQQEADLSRRHAAARDYLQELASELSRRSMFRNRVFEIVSRSLLQVTGAAPVPNEAALEDYSRSSRMSDRGIESSSLWQLLSGLFSEGLCANMQKIAAVVHYSGMSAPTAGNYAESSASLKLIWQQDRCSISTKILKLALESHAFSDHSLDLFSMSVVLMSFCKSLPLLFAEQREYIDKQLRADVDQWLVSPTSDLIKLLSQIFEKSLDRSKALSPFISGRLEKSYFDEAKQVEIHFRQDLHEYLIEKQEFPLFQLFKVLTTPQVFALDNTYKLDEGFEVSSAAIAKVEGIRSEFILLQIKLGDELFQDKGIHKVLATEVFKLPKILSKGLSQKSHVGIIYNHEVKTKNNHEAFINLANEVDNQRRKLLITIADYFFSNFDLRKPNKKEIYLPEKLFRVYLEHGWLTESQQILMEILDRFFRIYGDMKLEIPKIKNPLFVLAENYFFETSSWYARKEVDLQFFTFVLQRTVDPNIKFEFEVEKSKTLSISLFEEAFKHRNSTFLLALLQHPKFDQAEIFEEKNKAALHEIVEFVRQKGDIDFVRVYLDRVSRDELILNFRKDGFTPFLRLIFKSKELSQDPNSIISREPQLFVSLMQAMTAAGVCTNDRFDFGNIDGWGELHPLRHLQLANALHLALNGQVNIPLLECLLREAKVNPNTQRIGGNTPLHDLVEKKRYHEEAIKLLLDCHADPNIKDDNLESCIFEAVRRGNLDLVNLLVRYGVCLNLNNCEDMSPLVVMINEKNIPGIERLIELGANVNFEDRYQRNSLHWAINFADHSANSSFEIEDILIKAGVEINKKDLLGRTPLHYPFVKIGSVTIRHQVDPIESVNSLLAKKNLKVDEQDIFGNTPLMYAAQRGALVSALYLIDREADIDARNLEGNSILAVAMISGHDHLAITLLNKGAKWNSSVKIYSETKREKVYAQVMNEVVEKKIDVTQVRKTVLEALDRFDEEGEKKTVDYNKVIEMHTFRLAIRKNWQGMAYMILSRGYDIGEAVFATIQEKKFNYTFTLLTKRDENEPYQITDAAGDNLAHLTCYAASEVKRDLLEKIFRVLVRKGVSLHAQNDKGHNTLHCAAVCGSTVMIDLLLEQKIDPNVKDNEGRTPMMLAAENLNLDALMTLFRHTRVKNEQDTRGRTILHYICLMPNISDVDFRPLLETVAQAVDANEADSNGKLPLHYLLKSSTAITSQLYMLDLTADVNWRDIKGQSTVMIALKHSPTLEILGRLLDKRGRLNGADHVGRTAIGNLLALSHYSDAKKLEVLELILSKAQVDFNEQTSFKVGVEKPSLLPIYHRMTPLDFLFRSTSPSFDILTLLLKNGAKLDQPNDMAMKSLEIVLNLGKKVGVLGLLLNPGICKLPISCDFLIDSLDAFYAKQNQKVNGVCRLIEHKVDPALIQALVSRGGNDINKKDAAGVSTFIYAVSQREFSYLGPLLAGQLESKGRLTLDIAVPDKLCLFDEQPPLTTPLCSAIINYQPAIAHLLVANGASPNFAAYPDKPPAYYLLRDCHSRDLFLSFLRQFEPLQEYNLRCAGLSQLTKINFGFKIELPYQHNDDKTENYLVDPLYFAVAKKMPLEHIEDLLSHFPALDFIHPVTGQSAFSLALDSNFPAAKRILRSATLNSPYCLLRKSILDREDPRPAAQRRIPINERYVKAKPLEKGEQVLPLNQLYEKNVKPHHLLRAISHGADFNLQDGPKQHNLIMLAIYRNDLVLIQEIVKLVQQGNCVAFDGSKADAYGRTPIHAVVNSHKNGSFENQELLELLSKYYNINKADNNGFPPYYYAAMQDSGVMLEALSNLGANEFEMPFGLRRAPTSLISFASFPIDIPNYEDDADIYLGQREAELKAEKAKQPKSIELDSCVPKNISNTSTVVCDESGRPMDVYMTKVDIKKGQFGGNVFYRMQLLHETNRDVFLVVTRYGRIGDSGQHQLTSFAKKEEAVHEFQTIFKSKSGNDWSEVGNFQRIKKKYKLARFDQTSAKEELQDFYEKTHEKDLPDSSIGDSVKSILREVASSKTLFAKVKTLQVDTSRLPLSRLNKADLMQAFTLLLEIKKCAKELQEERAVDVVDSDPEKIFELLDELSEMTSDYFELIPSTRYRRSSIPPMEGTATIDQNIMVVRELLEVEVAVKILLGARLRIKEVHPLDYCYNSLNIKLMELDDQSVERSAILDYVQRSLDYGHPSAVKIFALERKGETERFAKFLKMKNRKLLWHGSRTMNFLGVLNRGLKIAPPEAPATGAMFGKGIYFSDSFAKAHNYCEGAIRIVLLCEVALGRSEMLYAARNMSQPSPGFDSVMGVGQNTPDPNQDVVIPNGMVIPLGPLVKRQNPDNLVTLNCNEFVVYNEEQVKIRYMVALGVPK